MPLVWLLGMMLFCTVYSDRAIAVSAHPIGDFVICYFSWRAMDTLLDS